MIRGPSQCSLCTAEDGTRPRQPAIVGFEPGAGGGKVVRLERQLSRQALQGERLNDRDLTRLGQDTVGEYGGDRAVGDGNVSLSVPEPAEVVPDVSPLNPILTPIG